MSTSSSSTVDANAGSMDAFGELCPEMEQGLRNFFSSLEKQRVDGELEKLRSESADNKFPYSRYALLLFRKYADTACDKIKQKEMELLDSIGNNPPAGASSAYVVDSYVNKAASYVAPYINGTTPEDILRTSGGDIFDKNIFRMRFACFIFLFIGFCVLSFTPELFLPKHMLTSDGLRSDCTLNQFSRTDVHVYFYPYYLTWVYTLLFLLATFAFCIYYALPIGSTSGNKYLPGMDRLCFLVTISPPSEPQGNFMDNVYRGIIRMQEFYGQCVRYCRTYPMHVMAGIDLVLLLGALAIVVQARYHLYANIVVELTMYNFFSVAVSPGPQDMYFNLQTFYETFSNVQGSPCLYSNPVPNITAGIWMMTLALIIQCFICRVALQLYQMERESGKGDRLTDMHNLAMSSEERQGIMSESQVSVSISDGDDLERGDSSNSAPGSTVIKRAPNSHQASPNKFSINDDDEEGDDLGDAPAGVLAGAINPALIRKKNSTDL